MRRLQAAGVRLIAGSDSAWGRSRAGGGWLEIDALTDAGLSPAEAIVAGTTGSAAAIGVADAPAASSRADRRMSSWSPATRSPTSPCSAILSTSSRLVAASSEAAGGGPMRVGLAAAPGLFQRVRGLDAG